MASGLLGDMVHSNHAIDREGIASNDANENPSDLARTGLGTIAEIAVADDGANDLTDGVSSATGQTAARARQTAH